jgi:hypothetical protein
MKHTTKNAKTNNTQIHWPDTVTMMNKMQIPFASLVPLMLLLLMLAYASAQSCLPKLNDGGVFEWWEKGKKIKNNASQKSVGHTTWWWRAREVLVENDAGYGAHCKAYVSYTHSITPYLSSPLFRLS